MDREIQLSIIILNYNTFHLTCQCIESIYKHLTGISYEIIVIDNDSSECDPELFLERFSELILIKNETNVGFGIANNQGMRMANGEYFLLLNSDVIVNADSIGGCYEFLLTNRSTVDVVGCKAIGRDGDIQKGFFKNKYPEKLSTAFQQIRSNVLLRKLLSSVVKKKKLNAEDYNKTQEVQGVMGSFILLKKEVFDETGGFDEDFFLYFEETEWFLNRLRDFKIVYLSDYCYIHLGAGSISEEGKIDNANPYKRLSHFLYFYKFGIVNYLVFSTINYFNIYCTILFYPFMKKETRELYKRLYSLYMKILPKVLFDIPRYSRSFSSRPKPLTFS